jgi:protein O-GlcNAc transferase
MKFGVSTSLFETAYQHFLEGRLDACELACRQALDLDPRNHDCLHLLGVLAGRAGRADQAIGLFEQALAVSPDFAEAHANRGLALTQLGRFEEAVQSLDRSLELKPDHVQAHYTYGELLSMGGEHQSAAGAFMKVLELEPGNIGALNNLGTALQGLGNFTEAVRQFRLAIEAEPRVAVSWRNLGGALRRLGEIDEAIRAYRQALALYPGYVTAHADLIMAMNDDAKATRAEVLAESRAFDQAHCAPLRPTHPLFVNARESDRRLRIGYVSGDLHNHPVGESLLQVLEAHDREAVEVFAYSNGGRPDSVTARIRAACDQWRDIAGASDEEVATRIRQDQIDILVDLSGYTERNRLTVFARKPAPVQASWLDYPNSAAISAIDYLILDDAMVPAGQDSGSTGAVVRLPHGRISHGVSTMADGAKFTAGIEAAYRQMWRRFCVGEAPSPI